MPHKETEKQIISLSTQITGEKPQTVSGPLRAIAHPRVALTLRMMSRAAQSSDLRSPAWPHGMIAWGGGDLGGGASKGSLTPLLFFHINLRPASFCERLWILCYTFLVVLMPGGWQEGGGRKDRYSFTCFFSSFLEI